MKKSVVVLTTYPFFKPRHGGQLRALNIFRAYESAGWSVSSLTVCTEETQGDAGAEDTCVSFAASHPMRLWRGQPVPLISDLLTGAFASGDEKAFRSITRKLPKKVDVFHLEQPWLLALVRRLKTLPQYAHARVVYGSQNIEAGLKQEILEQWQVKEAASIAREVEGMEREATEFADLSFAVSKADAIAMQKWSKRDVLVAPNGISRWNAEGPNLTRWQTVLPAQPFALFVASAHPPNITGFMECFSGSLGYLPPDQPIVIAGGVGPHILQALQSTRWSDLNASRMKVVGILPEPDLAAVKVLAHTFILPIGYGGGSNIKTAEALFSGKHVIGTKAAFRGFDDYISLPGVSVVEPDPGAFRIALLRALGTALPTRTPVHTSAMKQLLWEHSLAVIPRAVEALA